MTSAASEPTAARRIVFVVYPGIQVLDLTGPLAVFHAATMLAALPRSGGSAAYRVEVAATRAGPVESQQGLAVVADCALADIAEPIDTLIVAGGSAGRIAERDPGLVSWLRERAPSCRRVAAVCTGAFILAASGLLDGRRATTHWAHAKRLAARFPAIDVEPDAIYLRDGNIYTSAGVTAGMDLALALVQEDLGRRVALDAARQLVMFARRPGGQSQFSLHLAAEEVESDKLRRLQEWILGNLGADLSVAALAARAAMSERNFARVFVRETGSTPAEFVEAARLDAARRRLEESAQPLDRIALGCGFGTAERMRRAFQRRLRVTPQDYRARFRFMPARTEPVGHAAS